MAMTTALPSGGNSFTMSGVCPHCQHASAFVPLQPPIEFDKLWHSMLQCQGCLKFILGVATIPKQHGSGKCLYKEHYPLDVPRADVADEIPPGVSVDFQEALRCRWIKAFKATVAMCRRALQASCKELGAKTGDSLVKQIDDVASKGKITEPLQQMAHRVRLEGNKGAHPDDLEDVTEEDADAVVAFTREFFHHVYVMPAKLAKYTKP